MTRADEIERAARAEGGRGAMGSTGEATYRVVTSGDLVVRYIPLEVWAYDFTEAWRSRVEFCAVMNTTEEGGDDE